MAYHQDWLMRQIEAISAMLAFLLTGKTERKEDSGAVIFDAGAENSLYARLKSLVQQQRLCEAEDLLFEAMDSWDPEAAEAGIRFYADINKLSDPQLEQANFSREEIKEGLEHLCSHYGLNFF